MIYGLLTDLKQRRIVLPEFIDRLIEDHRSGHASYFGYAIWDLAMLEAWLSSHGFRP
jgi:asparagine synthase (glutamine-hydrolysing)